MSLDRGRRGHPPARLRGHDRARWLDARVCRRAGVGVPLRRQRRRPRASSPRLCAVAPRADARRAPRRRRGGRRRHPPALPGRVDQPSATPCSAGSTTRRRRARSRPRIGARARRASASASTSRPIVDVNSAPDNPVIGVRSFGADAGPRRPPRGRLGGGPAVDRASPPAPSTSRATATPSSTRTTGCPASTCRSTCSTSASSRRSGRPSTAGVACGHDLAHRRRRRSTRDRPATFSPTVLGVLRDELGFDGVIVQRRPRHGRRERRDRHPGGRGARPRGRRRPALPRLGHDRGAVRRASHAAVVDAVRVGPAARASGWPRRPGGCAPSRTRRPRGCRPTASATDVDRRGTARRRSWPARSGSASAARRVAGVPRPARASCRSSSTANLAVGDVAWGPAALGATVAEGDVPAGARVAVVGRAVGADHPARAVARPAARRGPRRRARRVRLAPRRRRPRDLRRVARRRAGPARGAPWRGGRVRLGIDIGGTKTAALVLDDAGDVVAHVAAPSGRGRHAGRSRPRSTSPTAPRPRSGAGRTSSTSEPACPGSSTRQTGLGPARRQPRRRTSLDLAGGIEAATGRRPSVDNDVKAAALGAHHAVRPEVPDGTTAYLNVGTGLAAAIVHRGGVVRGAGGAAGEIGHLPVGTGMPVLVRPGGVPRDHRLRDRAAPAVARARPADLFPAAAAGRRAGAADVVATPGARHRARRPGARRHRGRARRHRRRARPRPGRARGGPRAPTSPSGRQALAVPAAARPRLAHPGARRRRARGGDRGGPAARARSEPVGGGRLMEVVVSRTPEEAARRAAAAVLERAAARARAGEPVLGLATGSSPLGLYRELGRAVARGRGRLQPGPRLRPRRVRRAAAGPPRGVPRGAAARGVRRHRAAAGAARRARRVGSRPGDAHGRGRGVRGADPRRSAGSTCRCSASAPTATSASTSPGRR